MSNFAPTNLKDITIDESGRKVIVVNRDGFRKEFSSLAGKLAANTMVDGPIIKIKCTDGRTVIKWNPHTGAYSW